MNQIIRAENYRIRKNKTFRIACIVIIGMVLVGFALFYAATHMISGELMEAAGGYDTDVDAFTDINLFDCAGIAVSLMQILSILYAIVITIMIGAEKRNGVYSLMLERGYQTCQIYMAKLYATTVIAGIGYLLYVAVSLIAGAIFWHGTIEREDVTGFIRVFLLMLVMYVVSSYIYMAVAMNVKNAGMAVAVNLIIVLLFSTVITGLDQILADGDVFLRKYWLLSAIEQFAYIDHTDTTVRETITGLIEAVGYGGLAVFIGNTASVPKISDNSNSFPSQSTFNGSSMDTSSLVLLFLRRYIRISFSIQRDA